MIEQDYWISTSTGKKFNFININSKDIDIEDIIYSLSNIPRFNGHAKFFYSVLQHSLNVWWEISRTYPKNIELQLMALIHDIAETYVGDILGPLKKLLNKYTDLFYKIEQEIIDIFIKKSGMSDNIYLTTFDIIKEFDKRMCATEADILFDIKRKWKTDIKTFQYYNIIKEDKYIVRQTFRNTYNCLVGDLKAENEGYEPLLMGVQ